MLSGYHAGSLMRYYEYMDDPGIDILSEYNTCYWAVIAGFLCGKAAGQKVGPFGTGRLYRLADELPVI